MRTWARSHRGLRSLLAVVLLAALASPVVPAVAQTVPPPFTQANGCIDITGTWSTRNVPMTGTLAPASVPAGTVATLSGTTITQPIDLTQARPGLRAAATLAEIGTVNPADPTGPLLGQNDAATTATVALTGGGSTEGIRLVTGTGSQTFWSVSDGVTTLYFVGLPNPPTNTNLVPVTELDILVTLADTTWTAAGGSNLTVAEQSVAPSDLVVPSTADVASAPLHFTTTMNPLTTSPVDASVTCWPGTTATDPVPTGAAVPGASTPFATASVPAAPDVPTCLATAVTVTAGASTTVDAPARCTDPAGTLAPSTVTITAPALGGSTTVDPVTGVITYTNTSTTAVADQFSYTIANQAGLVSAPATVTVQIVAACDPLAGSCPTGPVVPVPVPVTPTGLVAHQADWFVPLGNVVLRGDYAVVSGALQPLTITDARGSGLGWSITASVSDFVDATATSTTCPAPTRTCIPGNNMGWVPAAKVVSTQIPGSVSQVIPGPSLSDTLAPWLVPLNGTGTGSVLCFAPAGQGGGTYRCDARLFLAIPASAGVGAYAANLTLTIA